MKKMHSKPIGLADAVMVASAAASLLAPSDHECLRLAEYATTIVMVLEAVVPVFGEDDEEDCCAKPTTEPCSSDSAAAAVTVGNVEDCWGGAGWEAINVDT
ncbi:hypothetical protein ACA910_008242 [Epithemia clementina (nom. ined.)]